MEVPTLIAISNKSACYVIGKRRVIEGYVSYLNVVWVKSSSTAWREIAVWKKFKKHSMVIQRPSEKMFSIHFQEVYNKKRKRRKRPAAEQARIYSLPRTYPQNSIT